MIFSIWNDAKEVSPTVDKCYLVITEYEVTNKREFDVIEYSSGIWWETTIANSMGKVLYWTDLDTSKMISPDMNIEVNKEMAQEISELINKYQTLTNLVS